MYCVELCTNIITSMSKPQEIQKFTQANGALDENAKHPL